MAFTTRDQIYAAIAAGRSQRWSFQKTGPAAQAAGSWASLFAAAGSPGAGTDPAGWANCTNLAGSTFFTDVSPSKRYLAKASVMSTVAGTLFVYDRLGHANVSLVGTGNKSVTSLALPRSMDTEDTYQVEAWGEVVTATTTSAAVLSMNSYTDPVNGSGRAGATITFPAAATVTRYMAKLPLQAGDRGVSAISTINVATAPAAGTMNVIALRPLCYLPVQANVATVFDLVPELPRVYDGSSICMAFLDTATTAPTIWGDLVCVYDS